MSLSPLKLGNSKEKAMSAFFQPLPTLQPEEPQSIGCDAKHCEFLNDVALAALRGEQEEPRARDLFQNRGPCFNSSVARLNRVVQVAGVGGDV
jgi:hypothetical protein